MTEDQRVHIKFGTTIYIVGTPFRGIAEVHVERDYEDDVTLFLTKEQAEELAAAILKPFQTEGK